MDKESGFEPINPESTEKNEVDFSAAENFNALYDMIRAAGEVTGSRQVYPSEILIKAIESFRSGNLTLDYITSTGKLRDTVGRLMEKGGGHVLLDKNGDPRYQVIGLMSEVDSRKRRAIDPKT